MSEQSDPTVTYQVKDLLDNLGKEINRGLNDLKVGMDKLELRIEQKASNERVAGVERLLASLEERHGERIKTLELQERGSSAVSGIRDKWTFAALSFVTALIGALIYLAAGGGVH